MTTPAVAGTTNPFAPAETPERTPTKQLDKDAFLQLLVAQLRYQNPLQPSDPNQFMAQTAQFTMVEKLEEIARSTAAAETSSRALTAAGLVGREVAYRDASGADRTGTVSAAKLGSAGPVLTVDGTDVELDAVTEVRRTTT